MKIISMGLFAILILSITACEKITRKRIRLDKWDVHKITAPGGDVNLMAVFLKNFRDHPNESSYIIDFYEDGTAESFNYLRDSLIYKKPGIWELIEKDLLYLDIDDHVNGTFEIHREKSKTYLLIDEENFSKQLNTTVPMEILVTRERDRAFRD